MAPIPLYTRAVKDAAPFYVTSLKSLLKGTSLQKASLPLLPWLSPLCSARLPWLAPFCSRFLLAYLGWRRPARKQRPNCKNKCKSE